MTKRIVYTNPDNSISIVVPAPGVAIEDCLSAVPLNRSFEVVDASTIPADREFRAAWRKGQGPISIDIAKAKEVVQERLRKERAPVLQSLDVEYLRAVELGDTAKASEVAAYKQSLRDATADPALINASTINELKAIKLPSRTKE